MKKQLGIVMAGAVVIVPLAVTAYVVWSVGGWLDGLGRQGLGYVWPDLKLPTGVGAVLVLAAIYLVGLLTRAWVFRGVLKLLDNMLVRVPGVRTIYESVRDLLQLFGGESGKMGRVVRYSPPGTDMELLGILTNEQPAGLSDGEHPKVALYLPYAYMFGGPVVYVSPEHIQNVDMSVEQCLKVAATAQVGASASPKPREADPEGGD